MATITPGRPRGISARHRIHQPASPSPSPSASATGPVVALGDHASDRKAGGDIKNALAPAKKSGRNVLADFGADGCLDCRVLTRIAEDPAIARR